MIPRFKNNMHPFMGLTFHLFKFFSQCRLITQYLPQSHERKADVLTVEAFLSIVWRQSETYRQSFVGRD